MPPQPQLVQQERRFYFIGHTTREILFIVVADSLDEARQKFRNAGHADSDALFIIKPKPKSISDEPLVLHYRSSTMSERP